MQKETLKLKLETAIQQIKTAPTPAPTAPVLADSGELFHEDSDMFAEKRGMSNRIGGLLNIRGSAVFIVIGLITAATVGNYLRDAVPQAGKYSTALAGVVIILLGRKNKIVKSFGFGVFLEGIVEIVKDFSVFSRFSEPNMYAETKMTWGGTDGVAPRQPDRMTFA